MDPVLSLQWFWLLLQQHRFNPWWENLCVLQVQEREREREKEKKTKRKRKGGREKGRKQFPEFPLWLSGNKPD